VLESARSSSMAPARGLVARLLRHDMSRAFGASMLVSIGARVLQVLMAALLGRQLGPAGLGVFTVATSAALLVGEIAAQGWPMLMSRHIPFLTKSGEWSELRGLLRMANVMVAIGSLLASAALYGVGWWVHSSDTTYSAGLSLAALLAPTVAFSRLRRQQYAALHKPIPALLIDEASAPLGLIVVAATVGLASAFSGILIYTLAWAAAVIAGSIAFRRIWPGELGAAEPGGSFATWWSTATGGLLATVSRMAMTKVDVLMLAPLISFHDAGIYGAALRITYILTFPQVVLTTVLTPRLSACYWAADYAKLRRTFLAGLGIAAATCIPFAVLLILSPVGLIQLVFGRSFVNDSALLLYLTFGQMTVSLTMPFTSLLLMTGREWIVGVLYSVLLAAMIAGNFVLIPTYGYFGPAYTNLVASVLLFLVQAALTYRLVAGNGR